MTHNTTLQQNSSCLMGWRRTLFALVSLLLADVTWSKKYYLFGKGIHKRYQEEEAGVKVVSHKRRRRRNTAHTRELHLTREFESVNGDPACPCLPLERLPSARAKQTIQRLRLGTQPPLKRTGSAAPFTTKLRPFVRRVVTLTNRWWLANVDGVIWHGAMLTRTSVACRTLDRGSSPKPIDTTRTPLAITPTCSPTI